MTLHRIVRAVTVAGALGATALAGAESKAKPGVDSTTFLQEAAAGGQAEVALGQLAQQRASNEAVKDFGKRMVTDHTKANTELKGLAAKKSVTLPTDLAGQHKALRDRLAGLSGEEFDREYMKAMTGDHEHDVAAFRAASQAATDADVRAFASKTLPTLEEHLAEARRVEGQVGRGASAAKNPGAAAAGY